MNYSRNEKERPVASRCLCYLPAATFFSGMAEIKARNALFTCSAEVKTFATSGSIMTIRGSCFIRAAKRFGFAFL